MFPGSGSILFNTIVNNNVGNGHHENEDDDEDEEDDDDGNESFSYWDNNKPFHVIDCLERYRNIRRNHATLITTNDAGTIGQVYFHTNLVLSS